MHSFTLIVVGLSVNSADMLSADMSVSALFIHELYQRRRNRQFMQQSRQFGYRPVCSDTAPLGASQIASRRWCFGNSGTAVGPTIDSGQSNGPGVSFSHTVAGIYSQASRTFEPGIGYLPAYQTQPTCFPSLSGQPPPLPGVYRTQAPGVDSLGLGDIQGIVCEDQGVIRNTKLEATSLGKLLILT
ncbi:unnamed protein product [Protopolystoma xenopodis]|uniref:Uncharacterized protein n=1 Tax=Protopolystoma xenopodis TaxID=117903 RepID=A0A448X058_9PLAT|nr:unnamed protein product [Protopolystoma xenopodis]